MKRILYPIMLFIIIGQSAIAQCVNRYKQKIVLAYYKTIQCNSDMERNLSIKEEAKRHNNADSLSYISSNPQLSSSASFLRLNVLSSLN